MLLWLQNNHFIKIYAISSKKSGYFRVDITFGLHTRPEVWKHNWKMELTGMNVCMFLHIGFLMESFSTVWARERTGIGVNEKMCRKCWRSFELFLTNMTFINLKINIIMILLVNLAKIRKSKLANHLVVWIWQKSCHYWKCSNMSILR